MDVEMFEYDKLKSIVKEKIDDGYVYVDGEGELVESFMIDNFPLPREIGDVYRVLLPSESSIFFVRKTDRFRVSLPKLSDFQFNNMVAIAVIDVHSDEDGYEIKVVGGEDKKVKIRIVKAIVKSICDAESSYRQKENDKNT